MPSQIPASSAVQLPYKLEDPLATNERRDSRMEFRLTASERAVIDQALDITGSDASSFAVTAVVTEAQRILADRTTFVLDTKAQRAWNALNDRPAKDLRGLAQLMRRPSPFSS